MNMKKDTDRTFSSQALDDASIWIPSTVRWPDYSKYFENGTLATMTISQENTDNSKNVNDYGSRKRKRRESKKRTLLPLFSKKKTLLPPAKYDEVGKRVFYKGENGLMCHQCQRNDKGRVVRCAICKTKRFCIPCIQKWYPLLKEEEIAEKCPVCRSNCNCKSCLNMKTRLEMEVSRDDEMKYASYVLKYSYRWFKNFHAEQVEEREFEAKVKGTDASELEIPKTGYRKDASIYCNKCNALIIDFHRCCDKCSYNLCLLCCGKFREPKTPSTDKVLPAGIQCPPKKNEGCGKSILQLKWDLQGSFTPQLLEKIDILMSESSTFEDSQCTCLSGVNENKARKSGGDNYVYCPSAKEGQLVHFQKHWRKGEPVIVRDVLELTAGLSWEPMVMWRAFRDTKFKDRDDRPSVVCVDSQDWSNVKIGIRPFFRGYEKGESHEDNRPMLLNLKDWPPTSTFNERLPRHWAEIITALPFKEYTHPNGPLNLARSISDSNIGMKMHIAYGIREELGVGDSVTKLHSHICDVVNILTHTSQVALTDVQRKAIAKRRKEKEGFNKIHETNDTDELKNEEDYGGALWDIWRREDVPKLKEYLLKHANEFVHHYNKPVLTVDHPIHDHCFYLNIEHKKKLKEEYGIEAWTFEQNLGEAVFVPAGCPRQVRNLKSCMKVAVDFVSPESMHECINLEDEFRLLPRGHKVKDDKIDVKKMAMFSLRKAMEYIEGCRGHGDKFKNIQGGQLKNRVMISRLRKTRRIGRRPLVGYKRRPKAVVLEDSENLDDKTAQEERRVEDLSDEVSMENRKCESFLDTVGREGDEQMAQYGIEENDMIVEQESSTEEQKAFLIELLCAFNGPHHRDINGWIESPWSEISTQFNKKFPLANFSSERLQEEEQALRKAYEEIKGLKYNSGFAWDCNTKKVVAPLDSPKDMFEKNPLAKEWHDKTFLYYNDLAALYEGCLVEDYHQAPRCPTVSCTFTCCSGVEEDCYKSAENESRDDKTARGERRVEDFNDEELDEVCMENMNCLNTEGIEGGEEMAQYGVKENDMMVQQEERSAENESLDDKTARGERGVEDLNQQEERSAENESLDDKTARGERGVEDLNDEELDEICMEKMKCASFLNTEGIEGGEEMAQYGVEENDVMVQQESWTEQQKTFFLSCAFISQQHQNVTGRKEPSWPEKSDQFKTTSRMDNTSTRERETSDTKKHIHEMEKQDEFSRKRLELESKRFDLENKYSFKNAMDIFDSFTGFSFEDYDKVTDLFLRDEKIRNAFIDVREEYKERWIRLRISDK